MLRILLAGLFGSFAAVSIAQVKVDAQDIGEIYQNNIGHSTILFGNSGKRPVRILSIVPANARDGVGDETFPIVVAPRTSVNIPVTVSSGMEAGSRRHIFNITTDRKSKPQIQVPVHFFALSVLDDGRPSVDLGTVNVGADPVSRTVVLSSREIPDFRVTRVVESPDFAAVKILSDGHTVSITSKADADWGRHEGYVKVALDSKKQLQAWIEVKVDVHGDVIPSQNPVEMGVFKNTKLPYVVQLKSRDGRAVRLGDVKLSGFKGTVTKERCVGGATGCAQISVNVADDQPGGRVLGKLLVDLPDFRKVLPIDIGGLYLPESVKVHSLNEVMEKNAKSSTVPPPLDLKSALQKSTEVALPPPPDPPGNGPLLKWQVSNESNVYGYMIYRGDSENGQFLRVNKEIIHVDATKGDGVTSTYVWRDDSATPGRTYWYYIGMINRDGSKQQLSGPQEVKAK